MSWKIRRIINVTLCCLALVILFTSSSAASDGIRDGLLLCAGVVIPSLFPFMVVSGFAVRSGVASALLRPLTAALSPLFRLPREACSAVVLSFFSGYPTGASLVAHLQETGTVDRATADRMMIYCVNAGPAMILFAVGNCLFGSSPIGWLLLFCHITASVLIGWITGRFGPKPQKSALLPEQREDGANAFVNATAEACRQMITICGFVTLFSAVMAVLPEGAGFLFPVLEVTKGCAWLVSNGFGAPAVAAALGFGGVSVMFQVLSMSRGTVSLLRLLLSRLCHAVLSAALCAVLIRLLPAAAQAASNGAPISVGYRATMIPCTLAMLLTASTMLWTAAYKSRL